MLMRPTRGGTRQKFAPHLDREFTVAKMRRRLLQRIFRPCVEAIRKIRGAITLDGSLLGRCAFHLCPGALSEYTKQVRWYISAANAPSGSTQHRILNVDLVWRSAPSLAGYLPAVKLRTATVKPPSRTAQSAGWVRHDAGGLTTALRWSRRKKTFPAADPVHRRAAATHALGHPHDAVRFYEINRQTGEPLQQPQ